MVSSSALPEIVVTSVFLLPNSSATSLYLTSKPTVADTVKPIPKVISTVLLSPVLRATVPSLAKSLGLLASYTSKVAPVISTSSSNVTSNLFLAT